MTDDEKAEKEHIALLTERPRTVALKGVLNGLIVGHLAYSGTDSYLLLIAVFYLGFCSYLHAKTANLNHSSVLSLHRRVTRVVTAITGGRKNA